MASKRGLRRKACGDKIKYKTEDEALRDLGYLKEKGATETRRNYLGYYKCPFGNHWHVGHQPNGRRRYRAGRNFQG